MLPSLHAYNTRLVLLQSSAFSLYKGLIDGPSKLASCQDTPRCRAFKRPTINETVVDVGGAVRMKYWDMRQESPEFFQKGLLVRIMLHSLCFYVMRLVLLHSALQKVEAVHMGH